MSKNVRNRRDKLWDRCCGRCYWCGTMTVLPKRGESKNGYDGKLATLDHLRSRLDGDRLEPNMSNEERTVLSCLDCNHARGKICQMLLQDFYIVVKEDHLSKSIRAADNTQNEDQPDLA